MATRTLLELRVFKHIVERERVTSQELTGLTKADKILLGRLSSLKIERAPLMLP